MARYRVSRRAVRDLDDIWYFIAKDSETAASRQIERLHSAFKTLGAQPLIGRARPEIAPHMRSFSTGEQIIYYRIDNHDVCIVRVWDGRRDPARIGLVD